MIGDDWSDVAVRLGRLASGANAPKVFGCEGHGWTVEPPLTPDELAELEGQFRVTLPEEYRSFLLQVSRGGAGPAFGLFPLRRVDGRWEWEGDGAGLTDPRTLAQPFPYTEAVNPADGLPEPPDEADFDSLDEFDEAMEAYSEHSDAVVFAPEHSVGLVYLCHLGCAEREALVVTGAARGQMWSDDRASDGPLRPLLERGARIGFSRWYRRWLDGADLHLRA